MKQQNFISIRKLPINKRNQLHKEINEDLGLVDTKIAKKFNISQSTVRSWIRNHRYNISTSKEFSLKKRVNLYKKAIALHKKFGWGSRVISRILKIPQSTVRQWLHGLYKPVEISKFKNQNSKELCYVIGVYFGDASSFKNDSNYRIELRAKDRYFVEKFNYNISKVLNKNKYYSISEQRRLFRVVGCNKELYIFLRHKFERLKFFIERYPKEFIRGLTDSEGSVSICTNKRWGKRYLNIRIVITNTNLKLLKYTKLLLESKFQIHSCMRLLTKAGSIKAKKGYGTNRDVYGLSIERLEDVRKFKEKIGFSIGRKQEKLIDAINIIDNYGSHAAVEMWKQFYRKTTRGWIKIF